MSDMGTAISIQGLKNWKALESVGVYLAFMTGSMNLNDPCGIQRDNIVCSGARAVARW